MSTSKLQGMLGKMSFSKRKSGGGGKVKTPSDNPRWEVTRNKKRMVAQPKPLFFCSGGCRRS